VTTQAAIIAPSIGPGLGAEPGDWLTLLKPRVISLVVFTGAVGLLIAPGHINPLMGLIAVFSIALGAGAAGAINMWYDADIDALMRRTRSRPIPAGRIAASSVLGYGIVLSLVSVMLMGMAGNLYAAGLLAFSIFYYGVVYTMWLKRRTAQNIVVGGAAGAFPPLIGWAAVTGHLSLLPILLFTIIFFWTPPHFWALSLYAAADYEKAGVPMLPVVKGAKHTRLNVLVYALVLLPISLAPWALGLTGPIYGLTALGMSSAFVALSWRVYVENQDAKGNSLNQDKAARTTFKFSLLYLFVLFGACAVDRLV
jgi:protoheme IX farnesyltransferase